MIVVGVLCQLFIDFTKFVLYLLAVLLLYVLVFFNLLFVYRRFLIFGGNDHTNMTAPLPVCSAKLSMFGPG